MILELLWIVGLYAAAVAVAHAALRRWKSGERKRHYVLVAGNHQMQIEWYVRSLQIYSRLTGMDIGITIILDPSSSDETGRIVERFARGGEEVGLVRANGKDGAVDAPPKAECPQWQRVLREHFQMRGLPQTSPGQVVWVELERDDALTRLPL